MSLSYKHEDQDAMGLAKEHALQREIDRENRDCEINRAMAEVDGWKFVSGTTGTPPFLKERLNTPLPRFTEDLNAVHEIEKTLSGADQQNRYQQEIADICWGDQERGDNQVVFNQLTATARQRCEAILKTLNRWNPEWDYPI